MPCRGHMAALPVRAVFTPLGPIISYMCRRICLHGRSATPRAAVALAHGFGVEGLPLAAKGLRRGAASVLRVCHQTGRIGFHNHGDALSIRPVGMESNTETPPSERDTEIAPFLRASYLLCFLSARRPAANTMLQTAASTRSMLIGRAKVTRRREAPARN